MKGDMAATSMKELPAGFYRRSGDETEQSTTDGGAAPRCWLTAWPPIFRGSDSERFGPVFVDEAMRIDNRSVMPAIGCGPQIVPATPDLLRNAFGEEAQSQGRIRPEAFGVMFRQHDKRGYGQ